MEIKYYWIMEPKEVRPGIRAEARICRQPGIEGPPRLNSPWLRFDPELYIQYSEYVRLNGATEHLAKAGKTAIELCSQQGPEIARLKFEIEQMMRVDYWHEQYSALKKQYDKLLMGGENDGENNTKNDVSTVAGGGAG